jgi:putative N6-adenine-specific DNA methylase
MTRFGLPVPGAPVALAAATSFGLEAVAAGELERLGYAERTVENGRVHFTGRAEDIARCNLWLRSADRLLVRLAEFPAEGFDQLFEAVRSMDWAELLPESARIDVTARSKRSRLTSLPACQATVKKAIVEALRRRYRRERFPESGPTYALDLALDRDRALLTLDTSGEGLHRRGYRRRAGAAPLRETLAAALILLSRWDPARILADPFCGSGTIPIEAALFGAGLAPGRQRRFAAEAWPQLPARLWSEAREQARSIEARAARAAASLRILGSDRDPQILEAASQNARAAGVSKFVRFQARPAEELRSEEPYGCLIANPPYGERSGELREVEELYRSLGRVFARLPDWSIFILTAHPRFQQLYGRRADKNRKLYNGHLKTFLYAYYGPLPRQTAEGAVTRGR